MLQMWMHNMVPMLMVSMSHYDTDVDIDDDTDQDIHNIIE